MEGIFQVSRRCTKPVVSAGKLLKAGFHSQLTQGGGYVWHPSGMHFALMIKGNATYFWVKGVRALPAHGDSEELAAMPLGVAAPVEEGEQAEAWEEAGREHAPEDAEEEDVIQIGGDVNFERRGRSKLTPFSKVEAMRKRLGELGQPRYGSKAELWKRLEKAERLHQQTMKKHQERQRRLREGQGEPPAVPAGPKDPTPEEKAQHELTHLPPADWCEHCIKGRAVDTAHRHVPVELKASNPRVEVDYSLVKVDGTAANQDDSTEVILSAWDEATGMGTAACLPSKSYDTDYVSRWLGEFVASLGHTKVVVRTDGEPAAQAIAKRLLDTFRKDLVVGVRGVKATMETAPRYSSQSLGGVGAFQRTLKTDVLTMRYDLEARYQMKLLTSHNAWPWMVRWAAFVRSRFGIKANGRTAYQDAFDTNYSGEVLPFGETAMFRTPISKTGAVQGRKRQLKGDSLWRKGIFLGKSTGTNEFLFGTEDGVYTARSVRRLPPAGRSSKELMDKFVGLPWDTKSTLKGPRRLPISRGGGEARAPELAMDGETQPGTPAMDIPSTPATGPAPTTPTNQPKRAKANEARSGDSPAAKRRTMDEEQQDQLRARQAEDDEIARSSGSASARPRAEDKPTMEVEPEGLVTTERKREAGESNIAAKRVKVGGVVAATLYKPQEDLDHYEEYSQAWEDAEGDADDDIPEVLEGKSKEIAKMDKYDTYDPRPIAEAAGKKILDSTWVIRKKPDGSVKCRFCLRDLKSKSDRDDVFAVASSQATSRIIDAIGVKKGYVFFTLDAENAFWQVPIDEECYMYPPEEWLEDRGQRGLNTDVVWRLKKEWYGRRVAGQKFVDWAAKQSCSEGFDRSIVAPWFFHNAARDISMEVHMDDFHGTGPEKEVIEFLEALSLKMVMKYQIHHAGDTYEHLRRLRTLTHRGMFVQPNPKYLKGMLKTLGLEDANPAPTPETVSKDVSEEELLDEDKARQFRSCVGSALYLSFDRPDVQHSVRELTKEMKAPTVAGMNALRRLTRYLKGTKDYGVWLPAGGDLDNLNVASDTDWASCKKTRKSCAGGVFMWGDCLIGSYSRGLSMICLSSGEAEFNGGVIATSEGIFYKEVLNFFRIPVVLNIYLDSSAARGVFQREGVGKIRHLETKSLWVQAGLKEKKFALKAVDTQNNAADIHTKGLSAERFAMLRTMLGVIDYFAKGQIEMRETVAQEMFNSIKKRAGTASARQLAAAIMASQIPGGMGMELTVSYNGPAVIAEKGGTTFGVLLAFLLVFAAVIYWWWRPGQQGGKAERATQTDQPDLSACVPTPRLANLYHTAHGERVHLSDDCPYIRGHQRRLKHMCHRCLNEATALWIEPEG